MVRLTVFIPIIAVAEYDYLRFLIGFLLQTEQSCMRQLRRIWRQVVNSVCEKHCTNSVNEINKMIILHIVIRRIFILYTLLFIVKLLFQIYLLCFYKLQSYI